MARLARRWTAGRWEVAVEGMLAAADLRRLERACAPALERRPLPLDLQLDATGDLDAVSRAFLRSLLDLGAMVVGERAAQWRETLSGPGGGSPASSSSRAASSVSAGGVPPPRAGR